MSKQTRPEGVYFACNCGHEEEGGPDDTLIAEGVMGGSADIERYERFVNQAPYDAARNIVKQDCPKCGMDHITMIRVGSNLTTRYVCDCGYSSAKLV
jgi:predicted RNA-binding Zn-ribbon protein involved in translation (DUF1610 family)